MEEQKKPIPDYKGSLDVAAWKHLDKNGKVYLSLKIATNVNLFANDPKPTSVPVSDLIV